MEAYTPITSPDLFTAGRYGLSSAVNWATPSDVHWQTGVSYEADCTAAAITVMECLTDDAVTGGTVPDKSDTWEHLVRGARAFTLYDRVSCSPVGDWWETGQERAIRALTNSTPTALERAFWSGASVDIGGAPWTIYPNLTTDGPTYDASGRILLQPNMLVISGGTGDDIVGALGALEAAFAECYDGEGVVHAPFSLGPRLAAEHLITVDGKNLRTPNGNILVLGRGYDPDIGLNGAAPPTGSSWMFMTSPIFGFQGPVKTFNRVEQFDRSTNTLTVFAERTHLLAWHCCLAGVLVSS
jgi:hypothetical protein